jgi:hypothetical protein
VTNKDISAQEDGKVRGIICKTDGETDNNYKIYL